MKIYLGGDHAGFQLKEAVKKFLIDSGYEVKDFGPLEYNEDDDYPDFCSQAAKAVAKDPDNSRGFLFGGSGQGEAMVANRQKGVRATVFYGGPQDIVQLSREHNNANILSLGGRFVKPDEALQVAKMWLNTPFSTDPRHQRRIAKF